MLGGLSCTDIIMVFWGIPYGAEQMNWNCDSSFRKHMTKYIVYVLNYCRDIFGSNKVILL